jgi:uncharacterized membrane protein YvlD (DUF360 family)
MPLALPLCFFIFTASRSRSRRSQGTINNKQNNICLGRLTQKNIFGKLVIVLYLLIQIISGILGLWLSVKYVPGVNFNGPFFIPLNHNIGFDAVFGTLVFVGIFIGVLNYFVKPILNKIAFPLRIITLNFFSLVIAMGLIWLVEIVFPELEIKGLRPLFFTTIIIWGINLILATWLPEKKTSAAHSK